MYCRNCGEQLNEKQAVCLNCGVKVGDGSAYCDNCGQPVTEGAAVCLNCGFALGKKTKNNLNGQDKVTMALVCFFLGAIGIHNFMMGEKKKGIIKIIFYFICGISGILALIDFIKILMDKYEVELD
jgi:uncharacterized membrane protein YvbJ